MTPKRALVLAGGGIAGIGWETGILRGIADESPAGAQALLGSDVLIGTSAGSTVTTQLACGLDLDTMFARQTAASSTEIDPGVSFEDAIARFVSAVAEPGTITQKRQRIGALAAAAATVPEEVRRAIIAQRLPSEDWPARDLRLTAIDIATGELVALDAEWGVPLVDAVASSCAVPGAWPPVTIGGRRFMDGGVGSTINIAFAADCDDVVAFVPAGRDQPSPFGDGEAAEIAAFGTGQRRVLGVFADAASLEAFVPNSLDPACRVPAALAGREQGRHEAARVAEFLGV